MAAMVVFIPKRVNMRTRLTTSTEPESSFGIGVAGSITNTLLAAELSLAIRGGVSEPRWPVSSVLRQRSMNRV